VAHGVNTAVKGDEAAGRDEVIDRATLQTRPQQLPPRDDTVLRTRDASRNREWSNFARYRGVNLLHPARIAPIA
jgi:hypothetical protein